MCLLLLDFRETMSPDIISAFVCTPPLAFDLAVLLLVAALLPCLTSFSLPSPRAKFVLMLQSLKKCI